MTWTAIVFSIGIMMAGFWAIIQLTEKSKTKDEIKNKTLEPIIDYFRYLIVIFTLILGFVPFIISQNPTDTTAFVVIGEWMFNLSLISFILYFFYDFVIRKIIYKYIPQLIGEIKK